jgi:hypothetical protein
MSKKKKQNNYNICRHNIICDGVYTDGNNFKFIIKGVKMGIDE